MMRIAMLIYTVLSVSISAIAQNQEKKLTITHLSGDFYIFETYNYYKGSRIGANGMYVLSDKGAILIDSPWDSTQFQPLLDSIKSRHNQDVIMCIATHFHEDRTGGLEYYRSKGIQTYTTKLTDEWSAKKGMKRAEFLLNSDTTFKIGGYSFEVFYPGHGHAPDNIVIWFKKEKILYGGCLIKSTDDNSLGNLGDASIKDYATTLKNVQRKFKEPKFMIPGHNGWASNKSLEHTLKMAEEIKK